MATLAEGGRIGIDVVADEIARLKRTWSQTPQDLALTEFIDEDRLREIELFDQLQLEAVIRLCRDSRSLADAGRKLFAISRAQRSVINDTDRLKKYLERFGLSWKSIHALE